jgi:hypothetical protein
MSETRKSIRRSEQVISHYWDCLIPIHRHQTPEIAQKCIDRYLRLDGHKRKGLKWTDELMAETKRTHESGQTFAAIGREYGVGGGRIAEQVYKWERILRRRKTVAMIADLG